MRAAAAATLLALALAPGCAGPDRGGPVGGLESLALRVHDMDAMVAFYSDALGFRFRPVQTGGLSSMFGERDGLTLEFVPLRRAVDFEGFPLHQPGFRVADVEAVARVAERCGGRREGQVTTTGGRVHAAVRDPDGNTIELYSIGER